jgi:hypothetical protein
MITRVSENIAYAHIVGSRTQSWTNPQDNVKVQFTYEPEKPFVDAPADLKFSIQNLETNQHLKDLFAKVTVTNGGQSIFKFNNITVPDGDFSIKTRFPVEGTYQVIVRIDSKYNAMALTSFKVFVPFQPVGIINVNSIIPLILPAVIVGIIITIAVVSLLIAGKRMEKK